MKLQDFETEVFVDCTNEFVVDATALPVNEEANLECFIEDPNGQPIEVFVNKIQGPNSIEFDQLQIDYIMIPVLSLA